MALPCPAFADQPARRLVIALGGSLFVHVLMVDGWSTGSGGVRDVRVVAPFLQAQLVAPVPVALAPDPGLEAVPVRIAPQPATQPRNRVRVTAPSTSFGYSSQTADSGPDQRFYLARELDRYPMPLSALNPDGGLNAADDISLWVSIDQAGLVIEAKFVHSTLSAESEQLARARVLATRFAPALRDGRPVKSRVLVVLGRGV